MSGGIIYDTNFYAALEAEVNTFRKALTKRWRAEVATACWENRPLKTAFRRYQAPYGEDRWDYGDPINRLHLIYGPCEVVEWAKGDQQCGVPSCLGRINSPLIPGQHVSFLAEPANQDGFAYRAVKVWPGGVEPSEPPRPGGSSAAYRSWLTLTFDPPGPDVTET